MSAKCESIAYLFPELAPGTLVVFKPRMKKYGKVGCAMVVDVLKPHNGTFVVQLLYKDKILPYTFMGGLFPEVAYNVFIVIRKSGGAQ